MGRHREPWEAAQVTSSSRGMNHQSPRTPRARPPLCSPQTPRTTHTRVPFVGRNARAPLTCGTKRIALRTASVGADAGSPSSCVNAVTVRHCSTRDACAAWPLRWTARRLGRAGEGCDRRVERGRGTGAVGLGGWGANWRGVWDVRGQKSATGTWKRIGEWTRVRTTPLKVRVARRGRVPSPAGLCARACTLCEIDRHRVRGVARQHRAPLPPALWRAHAQQPLDSERAARGARAARRAAARRTARESLLRRGARGG
eukprot:3056016-Prymnesium_polylepis.1